MHISNSPCCLPCSFSQHQPACHREHNRYLAQKVVASSTIQERCICLCICADQVPCSSSGPFLLQSVQVCSRPDITVNPHAQACLSIPLTLTLSDSCGKIFCSHSTLEYPMKLRGNHCEHDSVYIHSIVRLHHPVQSCNACFQGEFGIQATVYFLKHTVVCFNADTCKSDRPLCSVPCLPHHLH